MGNELDVMPGGVKAVIEKYIRNGKEKEELKTVLKEMSVKADMSDSIKSVISKAIDLIDSDKKDEAKSELEKLLSYYGDGGGNGEDTPVKKEFQFHMQVKSFSSDDKGGRFIEGLASATGIVDRDGEIMEKTAFDAGLKDFMENNPILLLNHDKTKPIGSIVSAQVTDAGLWVKAKLAEGIGHADDAWALIKQKVLRAFSVGGLFEKTKNKLTKWDLTEISVVSVPANQKATFSIAKAFESGSDLEDSKILELVKDLEGQKEKFYIKESSIFIDEVISQLNDLRYSGNSDAEEKAKELYESCIKEVNNKMSEDVGKVVETVLSEIDKRNKEANAAKELQDAHDKGVSEAAVKAFKDEQKRKGISMEYPTGDEESKDGNEKSSTKVFGKYDGFDLEDCSFAWNFYKSAGMPISRDLIGALKTKALHLHDNPTKEGAKMLAGIKSNELMSTDPLTASPSTGEQWIPTLESNALWAKIQLNAVVAPVFKSFAMPSNPYDYPLDVSGPTIYTVAEASAAAAIEADAATFTKSVVTTGKVTFNAKKMGALTYFSEELIEDSIIPILTQLKADYYDAMTRGLDRALLSGDETPGSGNISLYTGGAGATAWQCVTDGLRHESLVTTTTDKYDVGTLTIDDVKAVRKLMGTGGKLAARVSDLIIFCDPATAMEFAGLDEVLTIDKMGPKATVLTGQLGSIMGIPILDAEEYDLTDSSGYINNTGGSNVKGSFIIVNTKGVMIGYRRAITMTINNVPYSDLKYIVASLRFDVQFREAGIVGLGYDVTI